MQLSKLLVYFETSHALKLLRSPNAPFIVDFLQQTFKTAGRIARPHSELLVALSAYQTELASAYPQRLVSKAESYLADWCAPETAWLHRSLQADQDEPVYQLTADTEDVLGFLEQVLHHELNFVGTESRLQTVIHTLSDLAIGSTDDASARLTQLQAERKRIDDEIAGIQAKGRANAYRPAQIRERFSLAVSLLKQLQGDFRAVEESFRKITQEVQQRQVAGNDRRGDILQYALDAEDALKQQDQGVSFYEFVRLVLSPAEMDRLEELIQAVRHLPALDAHPEGLETVRNTVTLLQAEAEQVMRTNQRLSATLRRLLDTRTHHERQRVSQVLQEIRAIGVSLSAAPPTDDFEWEIEVDLQLENPFRREFWKAPARFEHVDLSDFEADDDDRRAAFARLANLQRLDWQQLRERIHRWSKRSAVPTLGNLLSKHPPETGIIEIVGYLQIACDDGHIIDSDETEEIYVPADRDHESAVIVTVPRVIFEHEHAANALARETAAN